MTTAAHLPTLPDFGALRVHVGRAPAPQDSYEQTRATIARMTALALTGARHPLVLRALEEAVGHAPRDARSYAAAIWRYVKARVRFRLDPPLDELLIAPEVLLGMPEPAGDCDDFSMLIAALDLAAGIPVEYVTLRADPADRERFSHVYARAILPDGSRFAQDASHGPEPGWEAPRHFGVRTWPVGTGLGSYGVGQFPDLVEYGAASMPGLVSRPRWWDTLLTTGTRIAERRYATPPPGTYEQFGPGGSVLYRGTESGFGPFPSFPPISAGSGGQLVFWLVAIGGILLAVRLLKR